MKDVFGESAEPAGADDTAPAVPAPRPVVTLDVALYESYLAESGMTEAQKREFLELLWAIIVSFVDLGFGVDPVQQAVEVNGCEQNFENSGSDQDDLIELVDKPTPPDTTPNLRAEIASAVRKGRRT